MTHVCLRLLKENQIMRIKKNETPVNLTSPHPPVKMNLVIFDLYPPLIANFVGVLVDFVDQTVDSSDQAVGSVGPVMDFVGQTMRLAGRPAGFVGRWGEHAELLVQ